MTTSHQHNHRHHRHPPLCLLVPFPPNSLVARNEEGSCGSARCSTTDDTATPHSPHCSSYIFTLQTIHYEFKIMFWILVSAPQLITHVCRWFSFFWFLSNSSRTRAKAVWSLGSNGATIHHHHHRQSHQLQTALARVLDELERNQKEDNHLNTISQMMGNWQLKKMGLSHHVWSHGGSTFKKKWQQPKFSPCWNWPLWVKFPRTGKMVKIWHFEFFWSSTVTKQFDFFIFFSTVLERFYPLQSKNVFVLVLAYFFEVAITTETETETETDTEMKWFGDTVTQFWLFLTSWETPMALKVITW